ncbi:hypothetical protein GCM10023167_11620 [Brevibacterium pityocampae]|uniref:Uncharacterized protein n=1 Tax=Brevibacterium pityocampae TaxID=506594 RepID=A0ABP8JA11_9MICO
MVKSALLPVDLPQEKAFILRRVRIDSTDRSVDFPIKPWLANDQSTESIRSWVDGEDGLAPLQPTLVLHSEGGILRDARVDHALDTEQLEHFTRAAEDEDSPWWVIEDPNTRTGLLVSREHHLVTVETDDDGATVHIHVEPRRAKAERDKQRDRFARRWGPWLDPDAALGPDQIRRGIARAEEMVLELLAEETTDDSEDSDA